MPLEIHKGSPGYYLHCPGKPLQSLAVEPKPCGWFEKLDDAEDEALRLAAATGDGVLVVTVVSKCIPWHCDDMSVAVREGLPSNASGQPAAQKK